MKRRESFGAYYFEVKIGGSVGYFRSCSGLKSESEVQEVAEGGLNTTTHKLIGRTKFPNLVLKQGFSDGTLFALRRKFMNDEGQKLGPNSDGTRLTGTIVQKGPNGTEAKWGFREGWICKWEGPDFDASKNEISIETIEIAHEGLEPA
ncbi:MAG: phage tail protein [Myxococcales bacterium]|nr:phage tail protein [Myxococcales bacterium]